MPECDSPLSSTDEDIVPDPTFWGRDRAAPRHRRRRPPGMADRIGAAIPSRDARTAIAAVVAVLLVTTVLVSYRASARPGPATTARAASVRHVRASPTPPHVVVHVAGAVTHPGVVTLPGGARVIDALDRAGGALAAANLDVLNLAARLHDGQQILVPAAAASPPTSSTTSSTAPTPTTTG